MTRLHHVGGAVKTTITNTIAASGAVSIQITSATGWPDGSTAPFVVVVDAGTASIEKMLVASRAGTTLTVESGGRGYDGSSAQAHSIGANIWVVASAAAIDEANAHVNDTGRDDHTQYHTASRHAAVSHTTAMLADSSVTTAKLADSSVTSAKLADGTIVAGDIASDAITTAKILDANVTTAKLADASVTFAKLAASAVSRWTRAAAQSIGAATEASISWTAETEDDLTLAAPTFTTITMPAGSAGLWAIDFRTTPDATPTVNSFALVKVNSLPYRLPFTNNSGASTGFTWAVYLTDAATVELAIYNATAGTINFSDIEVKMVRVGKIA